MNKAYDVQRMTCFDCKTTLVNDIRSGDVVCPKCGLVDTEKVINEQSEWRTFSSDGTGKDGKDPSRVGGPANLLFSDGGVGTSISKPMNMGKGGGAGGTKTITHSLSKWHDRASSVGNDRSLQDAFRKIAEICERMSLPQTIQARADELFKQIEDKKTLRGRNTEAIISACIYIACRQEKVPRSIPEMTRFTGVTKKDLGRSYKFLLHNLGTNLATIEAGDFLNRFCSSLDLPMEAVSVSIAVSRESVKHGIVAGKCPLSVGAASIYLVSHALGKGKSQREIALVAGVTEVTIRNTYKALREHINKILPSKYLRPEVLENLPLS